MRKELRSYKWAARDNFDWYFRPRQQGVNRKGLTTTLYESHQWFNAHKIVMVGLVEADEESLPATLRAKFRKS